MRSRLVVAALVLAPVVGLAPCGAGVSASARPFGALGSVARPCGQRAGDAAVAERPLRGPGALVLPGLRGLSFRTTRNRGTLAVAIVVDREGRVQDAEVLSGIERRTDARIVNALASARHEPAELDGRPVRWMMTFVMRLDFGPEPVGALDSAANRILPVGMLVDRHPALAERSTELAELTAAGVDERGWILAGLRVDTAGKVSDVRLLEGFHPLIDDAVLAELRGFEFEPARLQDEPIEWVLTVRYPIAWRF